MPAPTPPSVAAQVADAVGELARLAQATDKEIKDHLKTADNIGKHMRMVASAFNRQSADAHLTGLPEISLRWQPSAWQERKTGERVSSILLKEGKLQIGEEAWGVEVVRPVPASFNREYDVRLHPPDGRAIWFFNVFGAGPRANPEVISLTLYRREPALNELRRGATFPGFLGYTAIPIITQAVTRRSGMLEHRAKAGS
jgi:hypothetical protein